MKKEETPWSKGVVLVCTKCHKKTMDSCLFKEEGNAGENLKNYLKLKLREQGHAEKIRVVTSSCLDVCEPNFQAVTYASLDGATETFTLHPENDREELLSYFSKGCK